MNNDQQQQQQKPETETTDQHQQIEDDEILMESFTSRSRCCFCLPCFGSRPSPNRVGWEKLQQQTVSAEKEDKWWAGPLKGLKKIREWSELIAGPKWKTFIRRFNRTGKSASLKFHYDPLSYSLNFDDGPSVNGHNNPHEDAFFPDFSSRFAAIPSSCKSSMDLGNNGISLL